MNTPTEVERPPAEAAASVPDPSNTATPLPGSAITGLRSSLRTVSGNSAVYFIAEGGVRAATLLVTPLYTRAMTPKDYGILAVASTAAMVVTLVLSLQLDNAISRLTVEAKTDEERRRLAGTILMFLLTVPLLAAGVLELLGSLGYLNLFRSIPYAPYLRYAVWIGYLSVFPFLPIALYTVRGEAKKVLRLRYLTIGVQIAVGVTLIVIFHQGVLGALRAILAGAAVSAVVSVVLMARHATFRFSRKLLTASFALCLPIIPHSIANWILQLSDRVVLQRYVNDTQLGLYQLGYLVGGAATLFTNAAAAAMAPIFYWRLRDEHAHTQVPPLGSYLLLGLTFMCVLLASFGGTAIDLITPASYHGAAVIVPWVASSYIFVAAYTLLTIPSWYVMRTMQIAVGTILAAIINVGATFLFGYWFGIVGAGISTLIGYAFLALIQGLIADRLYPIPWEYRRWFKMFVVAGVCLGVELLIGDAATIESIALRACALAVGFPLGLWLVRFWTQPEQQEINRLLRGLGSALARRVSLSRP